MVGLSVAAGDFAAVGLLACLVGASGATCGRDVVGTKFMSAPGGAGAVVVGIDPASNNIRERGELAVADCTAN